MVIGALLKQQAFTVSQFALVRNLGSLVGYFWVRISQEFAGKTSARAAINKGFTGARRSSSRIAMGSSLTARSLVSPGELIQEGSHHASET